jgi:hypothetical protein
VGWQRRAIGLCLDLSFGTFLSIKGKKSTTPKRNALDERKQGITQHKWRKHLSAFLKQPPKPPVAPYFIIVFYILAYVGHGIINVIGKKHQL